MNREGDIRLKRTGGIGSPGTEIPEDWRTPQFTESETIPMDDSDSPGIPDISSGPGVEKEKEVHESPFKSTGLPPEEYRERMKKNIPVYTHVDRIYNLELIIYTASGQKFSARLNFLDRVNNGDITEADARVALEGVENDFKYRTFRRPITYLEDRGDRGVHEFVFNPANVVCVNLIRKY